MLIQLRTSRTSLGVSPARGASLEYLRIDDSPVLREGSADTDPRSSAGFPLAPFCNRLMGGLIHDGESWVTIAPNLPGVPEPVHGYAWLTPWTVTGRTTRSVTLGQTSPLNWPWAYRLKQTIVLGEAGVCLSLTLTNLSNRAAPIGLGFHPYFNISKSSSLETGGGSSMTGHAIEGQLGRRLCDGAPVALAELPEVDVCLENWRQPVILNQAGRKVTISAKGCSRLQIHRPNEAPYLCLEPVMNRPDYHDAGAVGLRRLAPGRSARATLIISTG